MLSTELLQYYNHLKKSNYIYSILNVSLSYRTRSSGLLKYGPSFNRSSSFTICGRGNTGCFCIYFTPWNTVPQQANRGGVWGLWQINLHLHDSSSLTLQGPPSRSCILFKPEVSKYGLAGHWLERRVVISTSHLSILGSICKLPVSLHCRIVAGGS